jgi:hypothetical protein
VEVDAMKRSVVLLAVIAALAALAVGRFAAQERMPSVEERINRLTESTARLAAALKKSEANLALLAKQVKANADQARANAEAHDYLARAISVDSYGVIRIRGNLRLENNVLEDVTVVNCDEEGTLTRRGGCTCPEGLIAIGIELRPQGVSAYPGPATHNTALICGRL